MNDTPMTKRQKRARQHNVATLIAFLTFAAVVVQAFNGASFYMAVNALVVLTMFVAIIVMFATRTADEYVAAIWRSGTSVAFVLTAAVVVFTPFFEGVYDGYMGNHRNQDIDLSADMMLIVIGSFFIANGWARLRGTV